MEITHFLNVSSGIPKQSFVTGKPKHPQELEIEVIQTYSEIVKIKD